jgi:hypothetical protein
MRRIAWLVFFLTLTAWSQTDRGTISGKIVKGAKQPVTDAIVKFTLERSPAGFRRTTKSRPPDGKFSDEMPQGWVLVSVFKKEEDGSIWVGKDRVKVDTNFGATVPEIRLTQQKGDAGTSLLQPPAGPPARVDGILSDGHSPLRGFISVNDVRSGNEVAAVTVGRDGRYSFALPSHQEYVFMAMAAEHTAKLLVLTVASNSHVDIALDQ